MKVLIVGLGSIAKKHIKALKSLDLEFEIYALRSNLDSENKFDVKNIYELNDNSIGFDFAIISNPTFLHYECILKLGKLEIPMFIEKPPLHSLDDYKKLLNLIEEKKIITYIACNLRFHPCIEFLKNKFNDEKLRINEVNVYCGSYLPDWRPEKNFKEIYSSNSNMGGGVHLDLFHEIDYTTWIFGFPKKTNVFLRKSSNLKVDAIDYANYLLEYPEFTANITLNYYRIKPKRRIEILLDNDIIVIDLIENIITNSRNQIILKLNNFDIMETYIQQLKYFTDFLINNKTPMNSFKESIKVLKVVLNNEK